MHVVAVVVACPEAGVTLHAGPVLAAASAGPDQVAPSEDPPADGSAPLLRQRLSQGAVGIGEHGEEGAEAVGWGVEDEQEGRRGQVQSLGPNERRKLRGRGCRAPSTLPGAESVGPGHVVSGEAGG